VDEEEEGCRVHFKVLILFYGIIILVIAGLLLRNTMFRGLVMEY
jgi:hypothetical protein